MDDKIKEFDRFLKSKKLEFEATIIGGAALVIMDIIDRKTKDVDCLDPVIPKEVKLASIEFAKEDPTLISDWLNNGPISLMPDLPEGWRERLRVIFSGEAITFHTLGRIDLLKTKLYAYCDRGIDLKDCIDMKPSINEIEQCRQWVIEGDANELWEAHVKKSLKHLIEEL